MNGQPSKELVLRPGVARPRLTGADQSEKFCALTVNAAIASIAETNNATINRLETFGSVFIFCLLSWGTFKFEVRIEQGKDALLLGYQPAQSRMTVPLLTFSPACVATVCLRVRGKRELLLFNRPLSIWCACSRKGPALQNHRDGKSRNRGLYRQKRSTAVLGNKALCY